MLCQNRAEDQHAARPAGLSGVLERKRASLQLSGRNRDPVRPILHAQKPTHVSVVMPSVCFRVSDGERVHFTRAASVQEAEASKLLCKA